MKYKIENEKWEFAFFILHFPFHLILSFSRQFEQMF